MTLTRRDLALLIAVLICGALMGLASEFAGVRP